MLQNNFSYVSQTDRLIAHGGVASYVTPGSLKPYLCLQIN